MPRSTLTQARLHELLHYAPETGMFTWRVDKYRAKAGTLAGCYDVGRNRSRIRLDQRYYYPYRLAFLYMLGHWPRHSVDHVNGDSDDNRWTNLRDVPHRANCQNHHQARKSNHSSGLLGVTWHKQRGKWVARITANGKSRHLGLFDSAEDAHQCYLHAKRQLHEGCTI